MYGRRLAKQVAGARWQTRQRPPRLQVQLHKVLWGDEPIDKLVSREELVRIVRTGHLGGRTRYRVMPS